MNNKLIRKANKNDIESLVEIWYEASIIAHHFIPEEYWQKNKQIMQDEYLPSSEIYVLTSGKTILGFISLVEDYLAAIFVSPKNQGKGIGSSLLNYVKTFRNKLVLKVYIKNTQSIAFYKSKGFSIVSESIDEASTERELLMEWNDLNHITNKSD